MSPTQLSQPKMTLHVTFGHTTCSAVMAHQPIALRTHGDTCLLSLLDSVSPSSPSAALSYPRSHILPFMTLLLKLHHRPSHGYKSDFGMTNFKFS